MAAWSKKPSDRVAVGRGRLRKLLPSGVWHFHCKDEQGKWVDRSTGHRDKPGAITWAEAYSMKLTRTEFGVAEASQPSPDDLILPALDGWLAYQKTQNKPVTWISYSSIARKFRGYLATRPSIQRLRDITPDTMLAYRDWAIGKGNKKVTVDNNLIALRSFFSWCVSRRLMASNPASQTRHGARLFFDETPIKKGTYTREEYAAVLAASGPEASQVFLLLANLGLRISELAMLEWSDVDLAGRWVRVRNKRTHDGVEYRPKDNTDRKIPLNEESESVLAEMALVHRTGYILLLPPSKQTRINLAERRYLKTLKDLAGTTGVHPQKLTLHSFRRFFVSECAEHGVPMATVMDWVGHDDMQMVMYYYNLRDESAHRAMRGFVAGGPAGARPQRSERTGDGDLSPSRPGESARASPAGGANG